jgi:Mg2+-importing ATPase
MVCIEDLGDLDLLVTDKTGTLTSGTIVFARAVPTGDTGDSDLFRLGLLASEADPANPVTVGLNALDAAMWQSTAATGVGDYRRLDALPFDHERRMSSALVAPHGRDEVLVVKGAAESVLPRCAVIADDAPVVLEDLYRAGHRVVAVASRPAPGASRITVGDERDLTLHGFLVFSDGVKPGARDSLSRLADLGIDVKIATGDSAGAAERICVELGMPAPRTLTGDDVDRLDDQGLSAAASDATIFARVSPGWCGRFAERAARSGFSATASTMRWPCTAPTSASPSIPRWMSRRMPRTSCCSTRISTCSRPA